MKHIRNIEEVQFESIDELAKFVRDLGHAEFYDDWEGEYIPIRIDDDTNKPVLGSDAWETVEERHLSNIYGFIPIK